MVGAQSNAMSLLAADEGKTSLKILHATSVVAAVALPVAVFSDSGSAGQILSNWIIAGALPVHGHIGMNWVIADYVPKASQGTVRGLTLALSVLTFLGLVRINVQGDGIVDTVKYLWEPVKTESAAETSK